MEQSVEQLCRAVFAGEQMPLEWLRAVKVPVKKKGTGEEFEHCRGVTLLSVIGKVFGTVLEARLRAFAESRGLLSDSQFGFRQGRACRDALVVLSEVVERRGGKLVYAGFLDIAKAYPSVWREGLWDKLGALGVRGRMLRVLRSLYTKCEVGVRVGGEVSEWYEEFVGVREGCVLSPLLFSLYINGIVEKFAQQGGGGVEVGGRRLRCLLFADDIVIVDSSKEGLQQSLDVAWAYSRRWRFEFNHGEDKSAVMVFGGADSKAREKAAVAVEESRDRLKIAEAAREEAARKTVLAAAELEVTGATVIATAAETTAGAGAGARAGAGVGIWGSGSDSNGDSSDESSISGGCRNGGDAVTKLAAVLAKMNMDQQAMAAASAEMTAAATSYDAAAKKVQVAESRVGGKWMLGDREMQMVDTYKYLGVRFSSKGGWKLRREELLKKARGGFWRAWGMGMGGGVLSSEGASSLWSGIVRSVLEYGCEVDSGRWEEAERLQRMAGRMALGVGNGVANEVVRGELGWWTVQARREFGRLVYWARIVRGAGDGAGVDAGAGDGARIGAGAAEADGIKGHTHAHAHTHNHSQARACARARTQSHSRTSTRVCTHAQAGTGTRAGTGAGIEVEGGIVRAVYEEGRRRMERGEAGSKEWCVRTKEILVELGLGEEWETEEVGSEKQWRGLLKAMMQHREEMRWKDGMLTGGKGGAPKTKLARYMRIKTTLRKEWYLREDRVFVRRWVRLRAGVEELEVEQGRSKGLSRGERICKFCDSGEVEDEEHFLERCGRWKAGREELRTRIKEANLRRWRVATSWNSTERTDWILQGASAGARKVTVMKGVVRLLFERGKEAGKRKGGYRKDKEKLQKERNRRRKTTAATRFAKQAVEQAKAHIDAAILSGLMPIAAAGMGGI
jgi:hypothetical protein